MKTVGERIKETRIARGLSQGYLADFVGIQNSGIAKYESGRVYPVPEDRLQLIAKALDVTVDYLKSDLEESLYVLDYRVTLRGDTVTVTDTVHPELIVSYTKEEWFNMELDGTAGFRIVHADITELAHKQKETPTDTGEGLSTVKKEMIDMVMSMDDDTVKALLRIADQVLSLRDK